MSQAQMEQEALSMLRGGKFQPWQIARKTGHSLTWTEVKAQQMGLIPLGVVG